MLRFAFICMLIALPGIARAQTGDGNGSTGEEAIKKEILKHEDEDHQAFMKGDAGAIDRLYADGVSLTYADGKMISKAQLMADIRDGKHTLFQVSHDNIQMRIYDNTVVVTGHSTATGKLYNKPRRFTNVYVKQQGIWRLVAHQVTYVENE
jgi:hypothetical protein